MVGFLFGGNTGETPESLKRKRELIEELMVGQRTPQNWGEGWGAVMKGIATGIGRRRLDKAEAAGRQTATSTMDKIKGLITGTNPDIFGGSSAGNIPMSGAASEVAATTPGATPDMTGNEVYSGFMDTVKTKVGNPYALAAIAATGNAESKFSPGNVNSTWSDPSESGQAGRAGGIMSWRGGRYDAMASKGDMSPAGQAKFFLNEDPQLIDKLNNAKSVEEAQSLMNNAWKFAGYNRSGGEAARRLQMAKSYLPSFQGGGETAALTAGDAIDAISPRRGNIPMGADPIMQQNMAQPSLTDEVASFEQTPEYKARFPGMTGQQHGQQFDAGRFGTADLSQQPVQGRQGLGSALQGANQMQNPLTLQQQGQQANQMMGMDQPQLAGQQVNQMGGQPQQFAQAHQAGQQQAQGMSGPSLQQLYEAASNPWLNEQERGMVNMLLQQELQKQQAAQEEQQWRGRQDYEQKLQQQDPLRQLQIKQAERELEGGKRQSLVNAGDGRIYDPNTGKWITAPGDSAAGGAFRFSGNSVEAQALNGLMDSGALTPDQAQQLGAGKTITGPNGEIIFMTPQGVFGRTPDGQTQQLSTGGASKTDRGSDNVGATGGNRQITEPKVTVDERKAMGFADRMRQSGALIGKNEQAGLNVKDQFVRGNDWIPDFAENWLVSNDFQKFDQARRDFINAQLRRESGAVISPEEFDNANKQYFPQPGDGEDVLKQKADNRKTVVDAMGRDAGPTYGKDQAAALSEARQAIARGANREAVIQRLQQMGINPEGL